MKQAVESPAAPTIVRVGSADELVHYVNDERYQQLSDIWNGIRKPDAPMLVATAEVQSLLFREARFLDDRLYDLWLSLYSPEFLYWVPNQFEPGDPRTESAIYLDDRRRMHDRIALIRTGHLHAQTPPSRTRRVLSNMEQREMAAGHVLVRANVVIWEYRKGLIKAYAGWQGYEIKTDPRYPGGTAAIATKIVCLLDCDAPQGNYTFIL